MMSDKIRAIVPRAATGPLRYKNYTQKTLELVFRKSGMNVIYLRKMGKKKSHQNTKRWEGNPAGRKEEEDNSIKMEERTYAKPLKDICNEYTGKIGVEVKEIRKGGKDEVRLVVNEDEKMVSALKVEISSKVNKAKVWAKKRSKKNLINGMDTATSENKIVAAFEKKGVVKNYF